MERQSGVRGYNWATLSLGDINTETWPPGWLDARLMTLLCKKFALAKSEEVETRWFNSQESINLAEYA
jgi:hypothetical protein